MNRETTLLLSLQERGATIWIQDGQLRFRAPKGIIQPEEMEELRARRHEILELLQETLSIARVPLESQIRSRPIPLMWFIPLESIRQLPSITKTARPRNVPFGLRILGALNWAFLQRSFDVLVRRHEPLRTRILMIDDRPSQHIDACRDYHLELIDVIDIPRPDVDQRIQEFIDQKIVRTIDPLFDARVFRVADEEHILIISMEHMITDSISIRILIEELWTVYGQAVNGQPAFLPPLLLQYADYALWLEKTYPIWQKVHRPYWEGRLVGAPSISWPTDSDVVEKTAKDYASFKMEIGERLTAELAAFARRERILPALVVLTMYVAAVSRWCNQSDLTVTLVDSGRHRSGLARMLGALVNHLHLRVELTKRQTYRDLLDLVRTEFDSASYHRDFDWVQSLIPQFRSDFLFNWDPLNGNELARSSTSGIGDGIRANWLDMALSREATDCIDDEAQHHYKLLLVCCSEGRELTVHVYYRSDLFAAKTMDRFARSLRFSLEYILSEPSAVSTHHERR